MKISIAISLLILAAAASLGWHDHQRLVFVREHHAKLTAEATTLGISIDSENPAGPVRLTKRERGRDDREAEAKLVAAEFIALAKEMEAIEKNGGSPDAEQQKKITGILDRMMSLDASQMKTLVAEFCAAKDLKDEHRQGLIGLSVMTLASDHPQTALALFTESSELFKDGNMGEHIISSSLARWAKDDPSGALEWVRKNSEKFPDLITNEAKQGLISGAASQDPKLAFKLIAELGLKHEEALQAISRIMNAANDPEGRTASLAALREHLASFPDEKSRNEAATSPMSSLAGGLAREGFESATQWIAEAKLSTAELEGIASGLGYSVKSGETGRWIEWIGETLSQDKADRQIRNVVSNWTENDYQAAGKWLAAAPDSPSKNIAIRSYAETISKYEPETAVQWALTLPPGKDREQTLKRIHDNWPGDDSAAKDAFAKEHGIK